jgi:hypothetical protein
MNLKRFGNWTPSYHGTQFYYPPGPGRPVALRNTDQLIEDYERGRIGPRQQVFLLTLYGYEHLRASFFETLGESSFHRFPRLSVVRVTSAGRNIKNTFRTLVKKIRKEPDSFRPFVILARMLIHDHEIDEAAKVIADLARLDKSRKFKTAVVEKLNRALEKKRSQRPTRRRNSSF